MASSDEFVCHRSVRPLDMLLGLVTSILLHSILLMGSKYWHRAFIRESKQEITQEIPIEVVEVPPNKTDIPPQTSLRARKDSIAGGKALPERPVSVLKSANPAGHKASSESSFDLTASSPAEVFQTGRQQQKTESPNLSRQQPQLKPQKTASAPTTSAPVPSSQKIAVTPMTTPLPIPLEKTAPNPEQILSAPTTSAPVPSSQKIAVTPITTPLPIPLEKTAPNPEKILSAPTTSASVPSSQKIAVTPMTTPLPIPLEKTAPNPEKILSAPTTSAAVPSSQKIAVTPMTTPLPIPLRKTAPKPKQILSAPTTSAAVPSSQKIAVTPMTTPLPIPLRKTAPKPKQILSAPTTSAPVPSSKKIAVAPMTTPLPIPLRKTAPKPKQILSAPTTSAPVPSSKKIAVAPMTTTLPVTSGKTALERATTLPVPSNPKKLGQSRTRLSGRTPSQAQSSLKTGAASLLGGTVGVSSQNYRGDELASLPNSNRDRQAASGIDARSQDIDLTSYLNKLRQRVQQQWLPEMSRSNRRTVLNFTINRLGQVSNLNIAQTSGFRGTDEIALNAIQRAAPFAPLPTGYPKSNIDIEFTFDINVYGELNLWGDGN